MPSRPSLQDALQDTAAKPSRSSNPKTVAKKVKTEKYVQPGRKNTKAIIGHFDPAVSKQLKMLAVEQDATIQSLMGEALNDLFLKYKKSPIA